MDAELCTLPKPPAGNLTNIIRDLVSDFCDDLRQHIDGGRPEYPFQKSWRDLILDLRQKLAASRPRLSLPSTAPDLDHRSSIVDMFVDQDDHQAPINLLSDDEDRPTDFQCPAVFTPSRKRATVERAQPTVEVEHGKKRSKEGLVTPTPSKNRKRKLGDVKQVTSVTDLATRFSLPEIREMIKKAYVGLQGSVDPRVGENMSTESMQHWRELTTSFLDETRLLTQELALERLREVFSPYQPTPLYDKTIDVCKDFLAQAMEYQRINIERSLSIETYKAMTFDDDIMQDRHVKALSGLQAARRNQRATLVINEQEAMNTRQGNNQNRAEKIAKVATQLGPDPYEQELVVMAVRCSLF